VRFETSPPTGLLITTSVIDGLFCVIFYGLRRALNSLELFPWSTVLAASPPSEEAGFDGGFCSRTGHLPSVNFAGNARPSL